MRKKCFVRNASIGFLILAAGCSYREWSPEDRRILGASSVVLVRTASVSDAKTVEDPYGGLHTAVLTIDAVLADDGGLQEFDQKEITLLFRKDMSHNANFVQGERYLLTVSFCSNGPKVVGNELGAIRQLSKDHVSLGQSRSVSLNEAVAHFAPFFSEENRKTRREYYEIVCGLSEP